MGKPTIQPFANEAESVQIAGLTIENRTDRVSMYGSIDITRDRQGLTNAETLKVILDGIVTKLKSENLPDKISTKPAKEVENPFSDKGK